MGEVKKEIGIPNEILDRIVPGANEKNYPLVLGKLEQIWPDEEKIAYTTSVLDHRVFTGKRTNLYRRITSSDPVEVKQLKNDTPKKPIRRYIPEEVLRRLATRVDYKIYLDILKKLSEAYRTINASEAVYFSTISILGKEFELNSTMSIETLEISEKTSEGKGSFGSK